MTKLLVLGGTGFVGRAICREAIRKGWKVTSLSRSGAPRDATSDGLLSKVVWEKGSALDPTIYPKLLNGQDYVIHTIGTLFESNPLYNLYKSKPVDYNVSYQALIRDSAEIASHAAAVAKIKAFGYISAAKYGALGNVVLSKYMAMKQQAEELLLAHNEFRTVIARPGFMYGSDRWLTVPMSLGVTIATLFTAGLFPRALLVDVVAKAMLNELANSEPSAKTSIMEVDDLFRIGV